MNEGKQEVEALEAEQTPEDAAEVLAAPPATDSDSSDGDGGSMRAEKAPIVIRVPFPLSTGAVRGAALLAVISGLSSASFGFTQLRPKYTPAPMLAPLAEDRPVFDLLQQGAGTQVTSGMPAVQAAPPVVAMAPPPAPVEQPKPQVAQAPPTPKPVDPPKPKAVAGLDSPDAKARKQAVRRLRRRGSVDAATAAKLLTMLSDSDSSVRESVVTALASASAQSPAITGGLITATRDSSESVRVRAVGSLGSSPASDAVVSALRTALKDRSTSVRNNAILTLVKHGSRAQSAAPALASVVRNSSNAYSRSFASTAVGQIGATSDDVVSALVRAMGDGNTSVRAAAKLSLEQLGDPAVSALSRQMAGGNAGVREVLQTIGTPGALAILGAR